MECPNCRRTADDAAEECSVCSFNFTKWKAGIKPSQSGRLGTRHAHEKADMGVWVWVVVLAAAAGTWAVNRWDADPAAAAASLKKSEAVAPAAKDSWRFEGRVLDLLRGSPIKGVKLAFVDFETGQAYEAVTDDEGRYSVDVHIRWKAGYALEVSHTLYINRYWTGSDLAASRQDRLHMGLEPAPEQADTRAYRGTRSKEPMTLDFALFPRYLTETEQQEAGQ